MNKVVNEAYRGLDLTDIQAACVLFEIDIDAHKDKLPPSVQMLAQQLPRPDKVWQEHRPGATYTYKRWTAEYLRAWAEKDGRYHPALLFPPEEITAADFEPDDFETFLRTDPTVELFAKILFAVTRQGGAIPEQAEIKRYLNALKLPSPDPKHAHWTDRLLSDAARTIQNLLRVTR